MRLRTIIPLLLLLAVAASAMDTTYIPKIWGREVRTVDPYGGGQFTTITDALASIIDSSTALPHTIVIMPGVYSETISIPVTQTNITFMGAGPTATIWQPTITGGHCVRIEDNGTNDYSKLTFQDIGFRQRIDVQPVPCVLFGTTHTITWGAAADVNIPNVLTPSFVTFRGCHFYGTHGPLTAGYGHEIHFESCSFWHGSTTTAYDVCLSDGDEENVAAHRWIDVGIGAGFATARSSYVRSSGLYGLSLTVPTAGAARGKLAYLAIPYSGATRAAGAGVNRLSFWMYVTGTVIAAGDLQLVVNNAVNGAGASDWVTIDLPAMALSTWYHISVNAAACAGQTIGSIWLNELDPVGAAGWVITIDDAWLETGLYGLHEQCAFKTHQYGQSATVLPQNWISFSGCLIESREYSAVNVMSGSSWQFLVQDELATNAGATAGTNMAITGSKLYAATVAPAANYAAYYDGVATLGANGKLVASGNAIQLDCAGATRSYVRPITLQQTLAVTGQAQLTGNAWSTSSPTYVHYDAGVSSNTPFVEYNPMGIITWQAGSIASAATVRMFSVTADAFGFQAFKRWRIRRTTLFGHADAAGTITATVYRNNVAIGYGTTAVAAGAADAVTTQPGLGWVNFTGNDIVFASNDDCSIKITSTAGAGNWTDVAFALVYESLPL